MINSVQFFEMKNSETKKVTAPQRSINRYGNGPNWDLIPSQGMKRPSDEELIAELKEIAIKVAREVEANKTTKSRENIKYRDNTNAERMSVLMAQYISSVSPDRRGAYEEAMANGKKGDSKEKAVVFEDKTIFDYLLEKDGIEKGKLDTSGQSLKIVRGGQKLLEFSMFGWTYESTPAEFERQSEFGDIYQRAYQMEKRAIAREKEANCPSQNTVDIKI